MGTSNSMSSSYNYTSRLCNGMYVYCDGRCTNCTRGIVIYSTRNQTTNSATGIHIVERPK